MRKDVWVAPRLRTASPAEADRSPPREGPVSSMGPRRGSHKGRRGTVESYKEDNMTTLMVLAIVIGALSCLAQAKRISTAVAWNRLHQRSLYLNSLVLLAGLYLLLLVSLL